MSVNGVTNQSTYVAPAAAQDTAVAEEAAKVEEKEEQAAVYEKGGYTASGASKTYDAAVAAKVKGAMQARQDALQNLVNQVISLQGGKANDFYGVLSKDLQGKLSQYSVDGMTPEEAQKEIGEDGYFGVKQTSERILEFAKNIAGDDPEMIEKMAGAIEKGFEQAKRALGGELPDISKKTYDAVQKGLDEWRESAKAKADGTAAAEK